MRLTVVFVASVALALAAAQGTAQASGIVASEPGCSQRVSSAAVNQAGLVVAFGDGRTLTFCIEFDEDSITGLELLQRSGLQLVTSNSSGLGAAVCSIEGEGCQDPGDCFCKCKGGSCEYWAYYLYEDSAWKFSPVGAGNRSIRNGDIDGWAWGGGSGDAPNGNALACAEPTPTNTAIPPTTPQPSATSRPAATPAQSEPSATTAPQTAETSTPIPAMQVRATPSTTPLIPTVAVLSNARMPQRSTTPADSSTATANATPGLNVTASPRARSGTLRVSAEEGERNLSNRQGDGSSSWLSLLAFGAVAFGLAGTTGVVIWMRRARV
jgi:hypothetical protein